MQKSKNTKGSREGKKDEEKGESTHTEKQQKRENTHTEKQQKRENFKESKKCFYCDEMGHLIRNCPKKREERQKGTHT